MPERSNCYRSRLGAEGCPPRRLIAEGASELASAGIENPRLDAETMLAAVCHNSRAAVIAGLAEVNQNARERYAAMITRRMRREPLAYILGHKEFYSLEFEVTPAVLIPRPETETVVYAALEFIQDRIHARVCDLGTGSGAIALAIAANAPAAQLIATDISADALAIAHRNTVRLELTSRVRFRLADCFEPLDSMGPLGRFDFIVSNPPYISDDQMAGLAPEIRGYEPHAALAGGHGGLELYRRIAPALTDHLEQNGSAIMEIGADQSAAVTAIMRNAGASSIKVLFDLAGLPRVVVAHFEGRGRWTK
ncbi:MAG: peptide chain release factor N(5)-glutamine methyltransferase [Deltaproteobacteria bacterium]|nr:peptide chain release factor N(5)-glutamine methyltransferase [Deltaproteobacteria bacterium]